MKIDKNIPAPTDDARNKYPYKELGVGESFFIPLEMVSGNDNAVPSSVCVTNKRMNGKMRFISRRRVEKEIEGFRVWRIK